MKIRPLSATHRAAPVLALVLVNAFGTLGQYEWAFGALGHNVIVAAGFAATLESIALFLTAEASSAMLANVRAGTLRLAAYLTGALIGTMNYAAHAGPGWTPNAMAIAFGSLSALSPWLWAVHSRRVHREALRDKGLVDPRTVKLPLVLWLRFPVRAFGLWSVGVWDGENRPAEVRTRYAERAALARLAPVDAIRYAWGQLGHYEPHAARVWLQSRGVLVDQAAIDAATAGRPPALPPTPPAADPATLDRDAAYHRARLAECKTNRDRIRYAFSVTGSYDQPAARRWLSDHGVTVAKSEVHAVAKAATGDTSSGAFPTLDPDPAPAELARINGHAPALTVVKS